MNMKLSAVLFASLVASVQAQGAFPSCTDMDGPCPECAGGCTSDADCADDLVCYQMNGSTGGLDDFTVPGCDIYSFSKTDYCVDPNSVIDKTVPPADRVCSAPAMVFDETTLEVMATVNNSFGIIRSLLQFADEGVTIGSTTALLCEANDASVNGAPVVDGQSGDIDFPFGKIKAIATVGERSVCDDGSAGTKLTGPPDGNGAYLVDDNTIRVLIQSESYGPINEPKEQTWGFVVNLESEDVTYEDAVKFTGSHVQYAEYDREMFSNFMSHDRPASEMVVGYGQAIKKAINLKGEVIGKRNRDGPTEVGAHYGNTDANGTWAYTAMISDGSDWFFQSFCSAHLEQRHQWGDGIGVEDNMFVTNEEWGAFDSGRMFVGLGVQVIDLAEDTIHAVGVFGQGGFEKNTELNSQNPDYVVFGTSGYNGNFGDGIDMVFAARMAEYEHPDGGEWVWPQDIYPMRIYVGLKGKMEDGSDAPEDDFLARNGLRYGKLYGFAVDLSEDGPTAGMFRDEFHKSEMADNGAMVPGKMIAVQWSWDGIVKDFQHDVAWEYQTRTEPIDGIEYTWWNGGTLNTSGCKTEHITPDPRSGRTAMIQGSTCGYFGHLYVENFPETLEANTDGDFPSSFDATYYVYQGERDITNQVELGGAGIYTLDPLRDATRNWDSAGYNNTFGEGKLTFEDVDGIEAVMGPNEELHLIIQEDSGSRLGERNFITGPLEHNGEELTYFFVAFSGGSDNTRMAAGVGIPTGVNTKGGSHEFSGVFDMSGFVAKDADGNWLMSASDTGKAKRDADASVPINEKDILLSLQAHNQDGGLVEAMRADRGGHWLLYRPNGVATNN